jgi:hypothetical protein
MKKTFHRKNKKITNKRKNNKKRNNKTKKMMGGFNWKVFLTALVTSISLSPVYSMPANNKIGVKGNKIYMNDYYYNKLPQEIKDKMTVENVPLGTGNHVLTIEEVECGDIYEELKNIQNTFNNDNDVKYVVERLFTNEGC